MPVTDLVDGLTEKEIDGEIREGSASPNGVPGYDKDQYIDPAILAKVKGGSYAYCDEDGNYCRAGFVLNYETKQFHKETDQILRYPHNCVLSGQRRGGLNRSIMQVMFTVSSYFGMGVYDIICP